MALILLCLLAISSTLAVGNPIKYKPCEGIKTYAKVSSVDIDPCPKEPCVFPKWSKVTATVNFIPYVTVYGGELETWVTFSNHRKIKMPYQLPYPCTGHGVLCPLYAGREYSLYTTLYILGFYPSGKLVVKNDFILLDRTRYFLCYTFDAVIEKKETDYTVMDALELTPAREI